MRRLSLALMVLAVLVGPTVAASVFQLDVCNKHRTVSEAPGTSLTFTRDGLCVVTSQVLTLPAGGARNCGASKASTAVLLRFPCKEEPRLQQASGPALNVWGSFEGIPQPTKAGVIVTESAPVKKQSLHAAKLNGADGYVITSPEGYVVSAKKAARTNGYLVRAQGAGSKPEGYVVSTQGAGSKPDGYVVSGQQAGSPNGYVVSAQGSKPDGYVVSGQQAGKPDGYVVSMQGSKPDGYVVSAQGSKPDGYVVSTQGSKPDGYVVSAQGAGSNTDGYVVSGQPAGSPNGYVVSTQSAGGYVVSSAGAANTSTAAQVGACSFLTLNPGLYFHRAPPMFTYGYAVSGVPCERAASALAATNALDRAGAKTFPTTYSLWLKPSLPAPPAGVSTEPQTCHLVVSVLQRSYVSTEKFPCSMRTLTPEELDDGCCYNAGGMGRRLLDTFWAGRNLLSSWEKSVWTRRAMLH